MSARSTSKVLTFAHSPDPDDAFMFFGFACGKVRLPGYLLRHHLEDIQSLNERAMRGRFEVTAVSAHAYAYLSDRYRVLSVGGSFGRGYGPVLIARGRGMRGMRVAVPGRLTTAALLLDLAFPGCLHVEVPFDKISEAVSNGRVEAGLLIHEGQLTYQKNGFVKLWDAGEWWKQKFKLPLPLGLDVVRRDLGLSLARQIRDALRESIRYAIAHEKEALTYALQYGRGLDRKLGKRFVNLYVNQDTLEMGEEGRQALETLYEEAFRRKLIPQKPKSEII